MRNNKYLIFLLLIYLNANAQENKTTFGLQFKPILSSKIFNYSHVNSVEENYNFNLVPNFLLLIHSNFVPKAIINKNGIKSGKIN